MPCSFCSQRPHRRCDCALDGKAGSYNPASLIPTPTSLIPTQLVPSGTLHRIALSSRNMSRRSCSSNTRSRSQGLVVVVLASLGTASIQNRAASKWAARRLAGRLGCSTRHMVYTPALPKPTHATAMPVLAMANSVHPSQSCGAVRVHPWRINLHPQNYCRPWGCRSR